MAKKKENKSIGYIILSFIPLFGIIWAAVAGIEHSGYVKEARAAEERFEQKFLEVVNNLDIVKDNNIVYENLNITCALPSFYQSKLSYDKLEGTGGSYSITLSANPYENNGKFEYKLVYEFFITSEDYEELVKNYDKDKVTLMGTSDYVYETYYPNNPKSSPIYAIEPLFDKCNDEILVGISPESVIQLIDAIPLSVEPTKTALSNYNKQIKAAESEYGFLSENIKIDVTNYDRLLQAKSLYNIKNVEYLASELPTADKYKLNTGTALDKVYELYQKLSEEEKAQVSNREFLEETAYAFPLWKLDYYLEKSVERKCSPEDKNYKNYRSAVLGAANTFATFTDVQIQVIKENGKYDLLVSIVNDFNTTIKEQHEFVKLGEVTED